MVVSAVSILIFLSALSVGVNDAMLRNTVGLFSGHVTGMVTDETVRPLDLKVAGVDAVLKRRFIQGTVGAGSTIRPLTLCLLAPEREKKVTSFHQAIVEGKYPRKGRSQILLSKSLAGELAVDAGERLLFYPGSGPTYLELEVSGLYHTSNPQLDWKTAFSTLDLLPALELPWTAAIFLSPQSPTASALGILQRQFGQQASFQSWEMTRPDLKQLIDLEYISMGIVIFLVFSVVAIGIACSFIIFIIRNIREYGIIKSMGATHVELSFFVILQVLMMNTLACGAGVILGVVAVESVSMLGGIDISAFTSHNQYFSVSAIILPRLTLFSLFTPPLTALFFSMIAALWPAALIVRWRSAEILRSI